MRVALQVIVHVVCVCMEFLPFAIAVCSQKSQSPAVRPEAKRGRWTQVGGQVSGPTYVQKRICLPTMNATLTNHGLRGRLSEHTFSAYLNFCSGYFSQKWRKKTSFRCRARGSRDSGLRVPSVSLTIYETPVCRSGQ